MQTPDSIDFFLRDRRFNYKIWWGNSHMAIRCAEFGIPAAIGCGEQRFDSLLKATHILLDAARVSSHRFKGVKCGWLLVHWVSRAAR